jgi:hypothetical protein
MNKLITLADKYMELLEYKKALFPLPVSRSIRELHLYNYVEIVSVTKDGVLYKLNGDYAKSDGIVEDVAFLVEMLHNIPIDDLFDEEGLGNFIQFIAKASKNNFKAFSNKVVAKVKEYAQIEKEMAEAA